MLPFQFPFSWLIVVLSFFSTIQLSAQCGACTKPVQRITYGNCSQGNTGFTSDLVPGTGFFCPLCSEGTYAVGTNAIFYHNAFTGQDHTNPGSGSFMICNPAGISGLRVWCQTVQVVPNTDYTFSFWGRDVANNPDPHPLAKIQASFNGVLTGDTLWCAGGWQQLQTNWNSGTNTQVEICLINWQDQTGGNDLGLDDISLVGCEPVNLLYPANAGPDTLEVCSGEWFSIGTASHAGYNYSWTTDGAEQYQVAMPSLSLSNAGPNDMVMNYYLASDSASVGCTTYDSIAVVVHPFPGFSLETSVLICEGQSAYFEVDSLWDSVEWTSGSTNFADSTSESGWFGAEVQLGNCFGSDSVFVNVVPVPSFTGVDPNVQFCQGDSAVLLAPLVGIWSTGELTNAITATEAGIYTYNYNQSGCTASFTYTVETDTPVELSLPESLVLCDGDGAWLDASWTSTWNTGETATAIYITEPGTYTANATNGTCLSTATVEVSPSPLPSVTLPESTLICEGKPFRLENLEGDIDQYLWNTGDTTYYTYADTAGWYVLTAVNDCGSAVDSVYIDSYACSWDVFAPNTITPNGDGINDTWKVLGFNIQNVHIWVYDRLGNLAFETYRLNDDWAPIGEEDYLYAYRIELITQQQESYEMKGHLLVLR
jgi:gliding motility-associated-like protein